MTSEDKSQVWAAGDKYEPYVGRWSRLVAAEFLRWIGADHGKKWIDVGCGTGALTQTILATDDPALVLGVDRSEHYLRHARNRTPTRHTLFAVSDAQALPFASEEFDVAVSGLVLNFVPQPAQMTSEMARITRPGGVCAVYVWDYADKMQLMRYFWDSAIMLDPDVKELDEGPRFPICRPNALEELFVEGGFAEVEARALDVPTIFRDFDDYWTPFLGGQGPAPSYAMSLSPEKRAALRETIREALPSEVDGSISLIARAWAVKGVKP